MGTTYHLNYLLKSLLSLLLKKQQLELDMEQQIGSKLGKENFEVVYCHLANLYAEYIM